MGCMTTLRAYRRWLTPGIGVKRWLILLLLATAIVALALAMGIIKALDLRPTAIRLPSVGWIEIAGILLAGLGLMVWSVFRVSFNIIAPYRKHRRGAVVDVVYAHSRRHKGLKVVAIGGGTGLPSILRGLKTVTGNITAVVTVADDGGSSGRLRRDMQVLPPGDLRNNIAALADDESLMTQLFQYRFSNGDLGGHAFGNLFISALAGVTGSLETALVETERVLGFVVEKDTPGFTTVDIEDKIALRAVQNALITLEGVRVPEENRLQEAHSFRETANVLRLTRAGVAWSAVGCSRGAYEHALRYAMNRTQFDKPIIEFQMVQDLLVRMLGNITASAAMCARLSQLQGEDRMTDEHASMAKAFCTVRMRETVGWARELMGGNGILLEHNVGRYVADAEAIYSYEGTREVNTLIVGRAITGRGAIV